MPGSDRPSFIEKRCSGMQWTVRADCAAWFFDRVAPVYDRVEEQPGVEIVKHSIRRIICRVGAPLAPAGNLILKRQKFAGLSFYLKYLAARSKAAQEWRIAWRLIEEGIPTFHPVALGQRRRWGSVAECCLVSEEVAGAHKLSRFVEALDRHVPERARREFVRTLVRALAVLVARLHGAGLHHPDLHGGNFLIRCEEGGAPELFLIDLHAVWQLRPLGRWHLARTLALLARSAPEIMTRSNLARLIGWYGDAAGRPAGFWREMLRAVEREAKRRQFELYEARDRRCLRTSTNFAAQRETEQRLIYRRLLKDHPLVGGTMDAGDDKYEITRYDGAREARAAWSALHGLRIRHVGAPRPHILAESRVSSQASCVLTERVPEAKRLSEWLREFPAQARGDAFRLKAALVRAVGERFHAACINGVVHNDCTADNVLAVRENGGWRVLFAQSPAVHFKRRVGEREQLDMLARFAGSVGPCGRTMAWRFYRECFARSPRWLGHDTVRRVWEQIRSRWPRSGGP